MIAKKMNSILSCDEGYNDQNVKINTKLSYINVTPKARTKFSV